MAKSSAKKDGAQKMSLEEEHALDTEITFLEGLLRRDGAWVDVLKQMGDAYTRRGRIQEGLQADEQLARLLPEDAYVFYNLACSYSLTERYEAAFAALARAIQLGYDDFRWLAKDPDMANLRKHPQYNNFQAKAGWTKH
jgi:tetratricopeptide (TPR) repeat protein